MQFLLLCASLAATAFMAQSESLDADLKLLLKELQELKGMDREAQIDQRMGEMIQLLTAPLQSNPLLERREEGTVCSDGITASCVASVQCSSSGTDRCRPICDSKTHNNEAHFSCVCKNDYYALLCDVTGQEVEEKCAACKQQGGKLCYPARNSANGYWCYDRNFKQMTVTERGLESIETTAQEEQLGMIAEILYEFLDENL